MLDQKFRNMKIILIHVFHRQMERMKKQIVLRIIYYQRKTVKIGPKDSYRARFEKIDWTQAGKAHTPNNHALNSDTHTLFLSILILNSQCSGVAIEGMDIWYIGLLTPQ